VNGGNGGFSESDKDADDELKCENVMAAVKEDRIPKDILEQIQSNVIIRRRHPSRRQQTLGLEGENPLFDCPGREPEHPSIEEPTPEKDETICVRVNDTVTYCFIGAEKEMKTVQIVKGSNQPSMGIINVNAPLARALIGAEVGDEVDVRLPTGQRVARILEIEKAR